MDNKLKIEIHSFSYKANSIPKANMLFDVRFLDNPYWVEKLRPLTGLDKDVKDFVLKQKATLNFLNAFRQMVQILIPAHAASIAEKAGTPSELGDVYTIAFGCTGGQHRSVAVAEAAAVLLSELFSDSTIDIWHREIDARRHFFIPDSKSVISKEAKL